MKFNRYVSCIDTHCSGESTRILVGGVPKLKGKTMQEKQKYFQDNYDHLVGTMLQEPRGFDGMLGSVLTEPCHPDADVGVSYLVPTLECWDEQQEVTSAPVATAHTAAQQH